MDNELRDLNVVRVSKTQLLAALQANCAIHRAQFEEALSGWHATVTQRLEEMLADASAGRKYTPAFHIPEPQDHTRDYARVMKMIEMSLDTEFVLTAGDFARYVLDDWGWKPDFITSYNTYTAAN